MMIAKIDVNGFVSFPKIDGGLDALQAEVDGNIEFLPINDDCYAFVNEEGKLKGLEKNHFATDIMHHHQSIFPNDFIVGPLLILKEDETDFTVGDMMDLVPTPDEVLK